MKETIIHDLKRRESDPVVLFILIVFLFCVLFLGLKSQLFAQTDSEVKQEETIVAGEEEKKDPSAVAVRVNGVDIMQREVDARIAKLIPRTFIHKKANKRKNAEMTKNAIQKLIEEEVVYQESLAVGFEVPKEKIDKEIEGEREKVRKFSKKTGIKVTFEEVIKKIGKDMDWVRSGIKRRLSISMFKDVMKGKFKKDAASLVTDEYAKAFYEDNMEQFVEPENIRLREMMLKVDPSSSSAVWEETKKKLEEIKERIEKGEDFSSLAKEFSEDSYAKKGGDMGFLHKGSAIEELDAAAGHLKVGEIGGPIRTLYGYHLIKVEERKPPVQKSFEDVKEWLKRGLKIKAKKRLYDAWLSGLKEKADIEYPDTKAGVKKVQE